MKHRWPRPCSPHSPSNSTITYVHPWTRTPTLTWQHLRTNAVNPPTRFISVRCSLHSRTGGCVTIFKAPPAVPHLQVEGRTSKGATENERGHSLLGPSAKLTRGVPVHWTSQGSLICWNGGADWKQAGRKRETKAETVNGHDREKQQTNQTWQGCIYASHITYSLSPIFNNQRSGKKKTEQPVKYWWQGEALKCLIKGSLLIDLERWWTVLLAPAEEEVILKVQRRRGRTKLLI